MLGWVTGVFVRGGDVGSSIDMCFEGRLISDRSRACYARQFKNKRKQTDTTAERGRRR